MRSLIYCLACIVLPVLWGIIVYFISNAIGKKVVRDQAAEGGNKQARPGDSGLPLDYHI